MVSETTHESEPVVTGSADPDNAGPESSTPEGDASERSTPEGDASDGTPPDSTAPEGTEPESTEPEVAEATLLAEDPDAAEEPEGATAEPDPHCPTCGAHGAAGARFCEECGGLMDAVAAAATTASGEPVAGAPVAPTRPCVQCGGAVADDGYCTECGAPAVSERDHFVSAPAADLGGVCDRGVVHSRNEDAMSLAVAGGVRLLVVCDGVSSAPASDMASMAAAEAAVGLLSSGAPGGGREVVGEGTARTSGWAALLADAARRANDAVLAVPPPNEGDAPSCTYVAAVVDGPIVVVANVGDSRAYWLPDTGRPVPLSVDDSWAQEMIEMGMPPTQAHNGPQAHAITRWLGADAPELTPRTDTVTVAEPGWLLLCSDGLWNYCTEADALAELVRTTAQTVGTDPVTLAGALVDWANAQGGRDNVTVALARLG